ncbi:unnamed protein product, partial [Amoebophrya sp. A25]|eukprot:GSA25T00019422001.1
MIALSFKPAFSQDEAAFFPREDHRTIGSKNICLLRMLNEEFHQE